MSAAAAAAVALIVFAWAVVSAILARRNVTGPLLLAVAGYLLSNTDWGPVPVDVDAASIHLIAEVALALLLFADAARVDVHDLRRDAALPARLLALGLPLSVAAGALLASALFGVPWGLALFLGAALAPTDAALSVQVITDERIPLRLRRTLNVESGLNDGIVTPIVSIGLAVAASQLGHVTETPAFEAGAAARELAIGAAVGIALGAGGALLVSAAWRRDWIAPGGRRFAALALAVGSLALALALDGNGFIAAFVAGAAFGAAADRTAVDVEHTDELPELGGELLALVVWYLFGAVLVPVALHRADATVLAYALASLTLVRMVPVALSVLGAGLDRPTTVFLAWFGPRGLASVVFALLALEELGQGDPATNLALAAITATVAGSIVAHGVSAGPGGRRYVAAESHPADAEAGAAAGREDSTGPRPRHLHLLHHHPGPGPADPPGERPPSAPGGTAGA